MKKVVAFDCETFPIVMHTPPGAKKSKCSTLTVPRMVVMSYTENGKKAFLLGRKEAAEKFREWLLDPTVHLVGANTVYDVLVMSRCAQEEIGDSLLPEIFAKYEADQVSDVQIREQLIDIATASLAPSYSLATIEKKRLGIDRAEQKTGPDIWRLRYNELDGVPFEDWPREAREYAQDDAIGTWLVYEDQKRPVYTLHNTPYANADRVVNEFFQARAALALGLMSAWGLAVDQAKVQELDREYAEKEEKALAELVAAGLIRKTGSKNMAAIKEVFEAAATAVGIEPLRAPKGAISTSAEALQQIADAGGEADPRFAALTQHAQAKHFRTTYLEPLALAGENSICPSYNTLVATGRTSSSGPNIQNFPSRGDGARIRECFVSRPGRVFINVDYDAAEMRTLAQACINIGAPRVYMAEAIREGIDLHLDFAAILLGIPYEEAARRHKEKDPEIKLHRDISKAANFGFPGGMGGKTFPAYAAGYGVKVAVEESIAYRKQWLARWEEMETYFAFISNLQRTDRTIPIKQHGPQPWRERLCEAYTAACNTLFQGMAADGVKLALFRLARECYAVPDSPLFGSRPCVFVHDEIMIEAPEHCASEAADRMVEIMIESMGVFVPDVPVTASPALGRRWFKGMESKKEGGKWTIYQG